MRKLQLPTAEEMEYLKMRIACISEACSRSRWSLAAITIVSCLEIMAMWNQLFAWTRFTAVDLVIKAKDLGPNPQSVLDTETLKDWAQSLYITSPILGIQVSASDFGIIGSVALLVLMLWHYHAVRRENHLISDIFSEVVETFPSWRAYVFHGVIGTQLFATSSQADQSFGELEHVGDRDDVPSRLVRGLVKGLFLLPIIAVAFVIVGDVFSLTMPSPFRMGQDPLFKQLPLNQRLWAIARIAIALVLATTVSKITWRAKEFQDSTEAILHAARKAEFHKLNYQQGNAPTQSADSNVSDSG
jgi:hypothetical protein